MQESLEGMAISLASGKPLPFGVIHFCWDTFVER
jgi:hypothetical protein